MKHLMILLLIIKMINLSIIQTQNDYYCQTCCGPPPCCNYCSMDPVEIKK